MTETSLPSQTALAPSTTKPALVLPKQGVAKVKSVTSGDTVVLLGKPPQPNLPCPEVLFTLEGLSAPRMASKVNPTDEPGAFPAREWLRQQLVGKVVRFETRKQPNSAGDRVYGWIFLPATAPTDPPVHVAVECVRAGHATPKSLKYATGNDTEAPAVVPTAPSPDDAPEVAAAKEYELQLGKAYAEAKSARVGLHATDPLPLVRTLRVANEDFATLQFVEAVQKHCTHKRIRCVIEYVFDGSRLRLHVTDAQLPEFQYTSFTLLLAGVTCPRLGSAKSDPPTPNEPFAVQAREFTQTRLLQRELDVSLVGTDKVGSSAVGVVHHPVGNIAVELLKNGLARMADWSVRLLAVGDVPALRVAENTAKRTALNVWRNYAPPTLQTASQVSGTVVEVVSGDTVLILPDGKAYDSEAVLYKVSLASMRAPRVGNERAGRPDEPYAVECKERLRVLTVGRAVKAQVHYERDIPLQPGVNETRPFATLSTPKYEDVAEVLIQEGLAVTQRHRDDDETSARYDELRAAEATAKAAKKNTHSEKEYKSATINDLTDPRKAKSYSGSLMRSGHTKAIVDYVFNGALFKLYIPSENCYIRFAPNSIRCPQPSPSPGGKVNKAAEPFGDESKRHARLHVLQRYVEIVCNGVTNSGIITGDMMVGQGGQRRDYAIELVGAGLATVDQRKIDYGEAPRSLVDAQSAAQESKVGLWSIVQEQPEIKVAKTAVKAKETVATIRLSEIRSGNHFFYHVVDDETAKVVEESMKVFTKSHGTGGAPCDAKIGKVVAALFNDGSGKAWYRAKVIERKGPGKMAVLFLDHGNVATVPVATHLRPLDMNLGTDRIPPVAKEAVLALTNTRPLDSDEGMDAARLLQSKCWGRNLTARIFAPDESGKAALSIATEAGSDEETINASLVVEGLARVAKPETVTSISSRMIDPSSLVELAAALNVAQEVARKSRVGMWRYGDIGDEDDDDM
jgi:staphylococcal nuclease domain-containing protein 1